MKAADTPDWTVVSGHPSDVELAALSALLSRLSATPTNAGEAPLVGSTWASPRQQLRNLPSPSTDAWRLSLRSHR
ncbi:MAG: acyl-CoA carboxylase subunit epsilon [Micropruina sp.]|nr:acyl-CoA carboxylase subunit epsilon [Micropruina sp.]